MLERSRTVRPGPFNANRARHSEHNRFFTFTITDYQTTPIFYDHGLHQHQYYQNRSHSSFAFISPNVACSSRPSLPAVGQVGDRTVAR